MYRILLIASFIAFSAQAADPITVDSSARQTAVVELYTSEGCSSCPPADKWLSKLTETPKQDLDVLALSFHVDYWNYLGWKDRFSDAAYTKRQRELGANNRQRTIYTPEFFVNGKESRGASQILDNIQQVNQQTPKVDLRMTVSREADELVVALETPTRRDTIGQVHHRYLVYENNLSTEVKRGENSGGTLYHEGVVRYMSDALGLQASNQHRIRIDPDWNGENIGVAVMVTSPGDLFYLQAIHTPVAALTASQ